jgi:DNA repair exonuclease SbcCD ATPase subunit
MLKIKGVTARNFLSIGAQTQAVNFDNCHLTLVLGVNLDMGGDGSRNGTGKTTIINALSYALYGEALTNIKKDNLINKTNGKGMMTTVDFEIHGKSFRIERGRRPNVLRFFTEGNELSENDDAQGDSRETQKEIEKVLGFPHEMFKHLVALNTYTEPFLSMKSNEQRDMIEKLLGITELSEKAEVLRELLKNTKEAIKDEETHINAVKNSNERIEKNILEIENRSKLWDKTQTKKLNDMLISIQTLQQIDIEKEIEFHKKLQNIKENKDTVNALRSELSRVVTALSRSAKKLEELLSNFEDAKNGVCPACGQGTSHLQTHEQYTDELKEKIIEEQKYNDETKQQQDDLNHAISQIVIEKEPVTFYDTLESALEHKHNLETIITQYEEKSQEKNPYVEQIDSLRNTGLQQISFSTMNELVYLRDHQEFLYKLLTNKDSFIRKRIIDQNISYLNHRLAYYLEKIGLPHEVKFSNDLSVEITEYGRDLDFDNLSRGERNRLILSLSWAFRDIYESLNHPMNLLCIDELIDSGMDTMGVENALAILKKMNREHNKSILLISHREELVGRVNNTLSVVKTGGFTEYSTDTEYNQ